jgi:hypothetical protein
MLTIEGANERNATCQRCGGRFRISLPSDSNLWPSLAELLLSSRIGFIVRLRALTGCGFTDAKGTMMHSSVQADACHWCHKPIAAEGVLADCLSCGSLNIRLVR